MVKRFKDTWEKIEFPVYALSAWSLVSMLLLAYHILAAIWISSIGYVIIFASFGYIGGVCKEDGVKCAAKRGALTGAIAGLVSALVNIFAFHYYPSMFDEQINMVMQQGVAEEMARTSITIGVYASLIISPLILAGLGALIALFFAWLMKERKTADKG